MTDTLTLPKIPGTTTHDLETLIDFVDHHVRRVRWDNQQLESDFGNRRGTTILTDGTTHYMGPCWDLTFITTLILLHNRHDAHILVEKLHHTTRGIVFHAITQIGNHRYIDQVGDNEVYSATGIYPGIQKPHGTSLDIQRIPFTLITPERSIYHMLTDIHYPGTNEQEPESLANLRKERITQMQRDNTPTRFEQWKQRVPQHLRLTYS